MLREESGEVGQFMYTVVKRVDRQAKQQVGVETGAVKASIKYSVRTAPGGFLGTVEATDPKSLMHHQGTDPHVIVPKKAKTLRFHSRGRIVYAKIVRHPGTKPNRFLTDSMENVINKLT